MKRILNSLLLFAALAFLLCFYKARAQELCPNNYECGGTMFSYNISSIAVTTSIYGPGVVYKNGTLYVTDNKSLFKIGSNGTELITTLTCTSTEQVMFDKDDNLIFKCYLSSVPNVYRYSFVDGSVKAISSFTSTSGDFSFAYDPESDTFYYITSSGFCTKAPGKALTCDAGLVRGALTYHNGYIYNLYSYDGVDNKITRWEKNKPFSTKEIMVFSSDYSGVQFNSRGEMFLYGSKDVAKYSNGGKFRIAGGDTAGYTGDEGISTNALISGVCSMAFDEVGNIYLTANNHVRKLSVIGCMSKSFVNSTTCEIMCGGITASDANVCSGNGVCVMNSFSNSTTCQCEAGFSGPNCATTYCFGIANSAPNVCGGNGTCISTNNCSCVDGWYGPQCKDYMCFNVTGDSPNVCSEYGSEVQCIDTDVCEHTCYNIGASSSKVCSGEGVCISENNCSCSTGRYGDECEFSEACSIPNCDQCKFSKGVKVCEYMCDGILSSNSTVCSGHGKCNGTNTCLCDYPYYGSNCSQKYSICSGVIENNAKVCSGKGKCVGDNTCVCVDGFKGTKCETCIDYTKCGGSMFKYRVDKIAFSYKAEPTAGDPSSVKMTNVIAGYATPEATYILDTGSYIRPIVGGVLSSYGCSGCKYLTASKNSVYSASSNIVYKAYPGQSATSYACSSCISVGLAYASALSTTTITMIASNRNSSIIFVSVASNSVYTIDDSANTFSSYALFGQGTCGTQISDIADKSSSKAKICAPTLMTSAMNTVYFVNLGVIFKFENNYVRRFACDPSATLLGDNGPALNASCPNITMLFTSNDGSSIMYADVNGTVRSISLQDNIIRTVFSIPTGSSYITTSYKDGEYLFANGNYVKSYSQNTNAVTNVAGTGYSTYTRDGQPAISAVGQDVVGVVYNNGSIYVAEGTPKRIRVIKNGLISTLVSLPCEPMINLIVDKNGNLNFLCYSSDNRNNLYRYSFVSGNVTKLTSISSYYSMSSLAYNPTNDAFYFLSASAGFCTVTSSLTLTCDSSLKTGYMDYYNGKIYNLYGNVLKSWDVTLSPSTATTISSFTFSNSVVKFNAKGEMFDFGNTIGKYVYDSVMKIAGTTVKGNSGDGGDSLSAQVDVDDITFDEYGNIYFIDNSNGVLRKLTVQGCSSNAIVDQTTCDISCGGLYSSDSNVCSASGVCALGTGATVTTYNSELGVSTSSTSFTTACSCVTGYTGAECQFKSCFGKNSTNPSVCSGNGTCVKTDKCSCYDGYEGSLCLGFTCGGVSATSKSVCSNYGVDVKCIGPNICENSCNGVGASSINVCSGEGVCSSMNNCTCKTGRTGSNCEISQPCIYTNCSETAKCLYINATEVCTFTCDGLLSTNAKVCSGNGICIDNNCSCSQGWTGVNCSIPQCNGILASDANVCSGNGTCVTNVKSPYCSCKAGYFGDACDIYSCSNVAASLSNTCSGNGKCIAMDTCQCKDGWLGSSCGVTTCKGVLSNSSSIATICDGLKCIAPDTCEVMPTYWPVHTSYNTYASKLSLSAGNSIIDMAYANDVYFVMFSNEIASFSNGVKKTILTHSATYYNLVVSKNGRYLYYSRQRYSGSSAAYIIKYDVGTSKQIGSTFGFVRTSSLALNDDDTTIYFDGRLSGEGTVGYGSVDGLFDGSDSNYGAIVLSTPGSMLAAYKGLVYVPYSTTVSIYSGYNNKVNSFTVSSSVTYLKVTKNGRLYIGSGTSIYLYTIGISAIPYSIAAIGSTPVAIALKGDSVLYASGSNVYELYTTGCSSYSFKTAGNSLSSTCEVSCNGTYSNSSDVCTGNGYCSTGLTASSKFDDPRCTCFTGASGSNCEVFTCFGKTPATACNGNGACIGLDKCQCDESYTGTQCQTPLPCNKTCNNGGICRIKNGNEYCKCGSLFTGESCEIKQCAVGGDCLNPLIYEEYLTSCKNNTCVPSVCASNSDCLSFSITGYTNCSSDGTCGFECEENSDCTLLYQDKTYCLDFSQNFTYKQCGKECATNSHCHNITKPLCVQESCTAVPCVNETQCYSNGLSVCLDGFCSYECLADKDCPAKENYETTCGSVRSVTSQYRKCVNTFITCFGINSTSSNVCSGHGSCNKINNCTCNEGYTGTNCSVPVCFGKTGSSACSSNGKCLSPNMCNCTYGFVGEECQIPTCGGLNATDPAVCNGGACIGYEKCIPKCFGRASNDGKVCSGKGSCISQDVCNCTKLYEGSQCETLKKCTSLTCLNGGECMYTLNGEECKCNGTYFGTRCEKKSCNSDLNCTETMPVCDVINGYCLGVNCTSNETCQAKGFFKCGLDGNCDYECHTSSDCPSNLPYCDLDKIDMTKYKRCAIECLVDGDCTKLGKTNCGTNAKDPQTYQRCYNKECVDDAGCTLSRGKPRCDTSVFRCTSVSCFLPTDCTPYGYPNCNSNGTCDVDCMVHDDCKLSGYRRCGMSSSNTKEYHKCVESCEDGVNNCETCASDRLNCAVCAPDFVWDGKSCILACTGDADCSDELKPICDVTGLCKPVNCTTNKDCTDKGFQLCTNNGTCGYECVSNSDCKDAYFPVCGSTKNSTSYRKCIAECKNDGDCNDFFGRPSCVSSGSGTGGKCTKVPCYPAISQCGRYTTNSACLCKNGDCFCQPECTSDSDCNTDFRKVCSAGTCVKKTCSNDTDCPFKGFSYCDKYYNYCKAECSSNNDCLLSSGNPLLNTCSKKDDMTLNRCVEGCKSDADCEGLKSSCDVSHATCTVRYCTDHVNCTIQGYKYCGSTMADKKYCDVECSYDSYCAAKYTNKPICSKKADATLGLCAPECTQDADCATVVGKKKCSAEIGKCVPKPCSVDGDCSENGYSFCGAEGVCTFECLGNAQCASKFGKTKCNLKSGQSTYQRCVPQCLNNIDCTSDGNPVCNTTSFSCEPKSCKTNGDCTTPSYTACKNSKCVSECNNDRDCIGVVKNGVLTDICDFYVYSGTKKTCVQFPVKCTTSSDCNYAALPVCKSGLCTRECMYNSDCPASKPYCDMSSGGGKCSYEPCLVSSDCTLKGFKQCWSKMCLQTECQADYQCTKGRCITDFSSDLVNTCQSECNSTRPCQAADKTCSLTQERCVDITCKTNDECSSHAPYTTCRNDICKVECEMDAHCTGSNKFCDLYRNQCVPEIVCSLGCVNGTCYNNTKTGEQKCICNPGYTGPLCGTQVQTCTLNCLNGGVCENNKCSCTDGFYGELCENAVPKPNPCSLNCLNGGSCVNVTGTAKCQCAEGYLGVLCQEKSPNPCNLQCGTHGTCENVTGIASCTCKDNFGGTLCSVCKSGFELFNSLCICNTSSGHILSNGECNCNIAANYQSSGNQCIRKSPVCEFNCGAHGACSYVDEKSTATQCSCQTQWVTSDATKPCSDCDSNLGLIISNGVCVCNTELGFTMNAQGKCIRNTSPKCDVDCGTYGSCEFETPTSTVSVCKCKNGFVTIDETKPCSSCPTKTIQSGSKCICDVSSGYTDDATGGCACDTMKGFKTDLTGKCICNAENGFTSNGKLCSCSVGFENKQGKCVESVPTCASPCGNGVCQFVNIAISTDAVCKCNKGYTSKVGEIPCSSCATDYAASGNVCKRVCPSEYSGDNCDIYTPAVECITLPSASLSFCKSSIDYSVLNSLYNVGAQNVSQAKLLIARNAARIDALAKEEYDNFISMYTQEGKVCDDKCIATLTKFACYMKFQSCSKRESVSVCKSVCEQVIKTELTTVPDSLTGLCNSFDTSNCFYGSYLPSDTTCFGVSYTSPSVCSGKGKCSSQDNCVCSKGYTGTKCELPICYDKDSSNSQVCSGGRGQCVGVNTCKCNTGFTGPECQLSTCNGKLESEGGCSFRGSCSDSHTCTCSGNFAGASCSTCKSGMTGPNCDIPICNGVKATDNSVCSGRGQCILQNNAPICKCNIGFDGTSCQNFKCNDHDRNSALVCGGRGKCTSYNTCACNSTNFDSSKFCSECTPSYTGSDCSEKVCSDEVTCSGHGKCDVTTLKCGCNGNWVGEFCNMCKSGFVGTDCQNECTPAKNCNNRGSCNLDGSCTCQTHATGTQCESCESGWFGEKCDFSLDSSSFGFSSLGDSISGTVYSSLKKKFLCSDLAVNHEVLGVGAKCLLNSEKSSIEITLGPSATITIGGTLQFKNYFGSTETTSVIVKNKDYLPLAPTASLTADKASVSKACGSIYLDASGSVSLDRRSLIFTWSTILAPTTDDSDALEALIASQSGSGVKVSGQTLGIGSYTVQVTVTSSFSQERSSASVSFQISDLTSPTVSIKEGLESTIVIGKNSIITPTVSFPSCYGGSGPLTYEYSLDSAKSVDQTVSVKKNKELLVFSNDYTKISVEGIYYFILTVSQSGAATVNVPFKVTAKALPLLVSFSVRDMTQSFETPVAFNVEKQDPSNPTETSGSISLSCVNLLTAVDCFAPIIDDVVPFKFSRSMEAGVYSFTAVFSKGLTRTSTASVKITVTEQPKSKIIRASIVPPADCDTSIVDPSSDFILQASNQDTLSSARVYTWSSSDLDLSSVTTNLKYIQIPKALLVPGAVNKVSLSIIDGDRSGTADITFTVNSPPTVGILEVSPTTGVALKDEFQIKCGNGWYDPQVPLSYEFLYKLKEESTWSILSSKSEKKSISTSLPAGTLDIKVVVYDANGASSETITQIVTTVPTPKEALAALTVSQQGSVTVSSISSALSVVGSVSEASPEEKEALKAAGTAFVDKYFKQADEQGTVVAETSDSVASKVSVISSIGGCVNNLADSTVSFSVTKFSETSSTASTSSSIKMNDQDITNSQNSANAFSSYIASTLRRTFTLDDMSRIEQIFSDLVNVQIKNLVADMPAVKTSTSSMNVYARLVSISTLEGLNENIDSTTSFNLTKDFTSMPEFDQVENVKLYYKTQSTTIKSAITKIVEFSIFNINQQMIFNKNQTIATISVPKLSSGRNLHTSVVNKCFELQNGSYVQSAQCTVLSESVKSVTIETRNTGSFMVQVVSQAETSTTSPEQSKPHIIITPKPNMDLIALVLLAIPVIALVAVIIAVVYLMKKRKGGNHHVPKNLNEKELLSI